MRILLVTHYFEPENAAPQRRWRGIGEQLIAAGHQLHVLCPPPHYPHGTATRAELRAHRPGSIQRTEWGAVVHRTSFLPHGAGMLSRTLDHVWSAASATRIAERRFGRSRPDVIIATAPGIPSLIAGRLLGWRWAVPVVVEMRDAWPDLVTHVPGLAQGTGPMAVAKRFIHAEMSDWQRRASRVVTTTQRFADVLEGRGIERPVVIRNGTRLERYAQVPPRPDPIAEDGSVRPLHALYMGNLGRSQGLDAVVRVAARLREAGVPIEVRLVGHGAHAKALRKLNQELGSPVEVRDGVPASEVASHYAWADTTIVSLRDWAPFEWTVPSKLYELLAVGRHITCILGGEGAEIVAETDAGDVVRPGDEDALAALWALLAASPEAVAERPEGREWVRDHVAYEHLAAQYVEVLEGAVERARLVPPTDRLRLALRHLARSLAGLRRASRSGSRADAWSSPADA